MHAEYIIRRNNSVISSANVRKLRRDYAVIRASAFWMGVSRPVIRYQQLWIIHRYLRTTTYIRGAGGASQLLLIVLYDACVDKAEKAETETEIDGERKEETAERAVKAKEAAGTSCSGVK